MTRTYLRDPEVIYRLSFGIARHESDLSRFGRDEAEVAIRLVHACGRPEIAPDLAFSPGVVAAARSALGSGADLLADSEMTARGITSVSVRTAIAEARAEPGQTRAMAAMDLLAAHLAGAVVAVGNAPTALFRLLELVDAGAARPAAVLGFPVGFVGAAEAKEALIASGLPFITLRGRFGGSALAAAAANALLGSGGGVP